MVSKMVMIHDDAKKFQRFTGVFAERKSGPNLFGYGAEENVENSCTKGISTPPSFDALSQMNFLLLKPTIGRVEPLSFASTKLCDGVDVKFRVVFLFL
jgi:hypothetical protein